MKKILVSMMTIALVSALIGGGVYATFSDPETSGSSGVGAGTLDLTLDGQNDSGTILFTKADWEPDKAGNDFAVLKNLGNLNADIEFEMGIAKSIESTGTLGTADSGTDGDSLVDAALNQDTDDYWKGYTLTYTSGAASGETQVVTGFAHATDTITTAAFTGTPAENDTYALYTEYERDTVTDETDWTATGGTVNTIIDTGDLTQTDTDYWKDYYVTITSGHADNVGETRKVTGFNPGTDTITVDADFPQVVASGNGYQLHLGELTSGISMTLWCDLSDPLNGTFDNGTDYCLKSDGTVVQDGLVYDTMAAYSGTDWAANQVPLDGGKTVDFYLAWTGGTATSTAQGDSFAFVMKFDLVQR